jgi:hypothetical protein
VLKHNVSHPGIRPGDLDDRHQVYAWTEGNFKFANLPCASKAAQHAVCRCNNRRLPTGVRERSWQLTYDVTNAANFAAGERRILGGNKNYLLVDDN